jgi:hypothetical protein
MSGGVRGGGATPPPTRFKYGSIRQRSEGARFWTVPVLLRRAARRSVKVLGLGSFGLYAGL